MKTCQQCGTRFDPIHERPSHPAKFCSRACRDESQRTRVTLTCRQCGTEFRRKAYMAKWSQERGPFCGFACYGRWQAAQTVGPANPNYREQSPLRRSSQWERARLSALARDKSRCVRCGRTDGLHVHHKKPWKPNQKNPHALGNLETLCASCHRKQHPVPHGPNGKFVSTR